MNAVTTYQQVALTTQNQERIIVLLYEGAIRFLRQARLGMQNRDYAKKSAFLAKAQNIVFELNASLDMEIGDEIPSHLRALYAFVWAKLNQVNAKNDISLLDRLISILETLAEGWRRIST